MAPAIPKGELQDGWEVWHSLGAARPGQIPGMDTAPVSVSQCYLGRQHVVLPPHCASHPALHPSPPLGSMVPCISQLVQALNGKQHRHPHPY